MCFCVIKSPNVKLLFIGSTQFSLRCLQTLKEISFLNVCGIISGHRTYTAHTGQLVNSVLYADLEDYAIEHSIPFYRMKTSMNEQPLRDFVASCDSDFAICVGWYHRVPKWLLEIHQVAGLHASLLPDYSGGAPLVWAMINGEKQTGITFFLFSEQMDSGDIIGQQEIEILDEDTIRTLYAKVEVLGLDLLKEYLPKLADGSVVYRKQDESKRRIFPSRRPEDGLIDWSWDAKRIRNFIRAQTRPYPGAFTILHGKKIVIWDADIDEEE